MVVQQTRSTVIVSEKELRARFFVRLTLAKTFCGLTNAEIARRTRSSESSVGSWFDPRTKALPDGIKMLQLPYALGVSGHWLMTGEGAMVQAHGVVQGAREAIARTQQFLDEMRVTVGPKEDGSHQERGPDRRQA